MNFTWLLFEAALAFFYAALLRHYLRHWRALPEWRVPTGFEPGTRVSVIIPARNEAGNIDACLRSVCATDYPAHLLEIIVVDDHSDDATTARAAAFQSVRVLQAPAGKQGKKAALALGITAASGELIVTTDADCLVPEQWLQLLVSKYESVCTDKGCIIAAPVVFTAEKNGFERFQSLDFLGLMGITGAGIHSGRQRMGNGANLAYSKNLFEAVGGFTGIDTRASGDDMFLLQKIAREYPWHIHFLKSPSAAVRTRAMPGLRAFVQQRIRWGTKNAALPEWHIRIALALVFVFCWSILWNILRGNLLVLLGLLAVKAVADYIFLREMCRFFQRKDLLHWFLPSFFQHIIYVALIGAASLLLHRYRWKGRLTR